MNKLKLLPAGAEYRYVDADSNHRFLAHQIVRPEAVRIIRRAVPRVSDEVNAMQTIYHLLGYGCTEEAAREMASKRG